MKNEAYSVSATDIEIWARIGIHKEEAFVENCFRVSVKVDAVKSYQKHHYINYEAILDTVKQVFNRPQKVLEDICVEIIDELRLAMPEEVLAIECEIRKIKPAAEGLAVGSLGVKIVKTY